MYGITEFLIDWAVIFIAGAITYMATESYVWAVSACVLTGVYTTWTFKRGAMALKRAIAQGIEKKIAEMIQGNDPQQ